MSTKLRLKLDDQGHAVIRGDAPVYVRNDGEEVVFDVAKTLARAERAETTIAVRDQFENSHLVIDGRLALPAPIVRAAFEKAFRVEDGKIVAYGDDGSKVYSRSRPGEVADFEEALELLIARHPHRDAILRGAPEQKADEGAPPKASSVIRRAAFETLRPVEQMAHIKAGGTVVD